MNSPPVSALSYETLRQVTPHAGVVLARNPSGMTLDGTNTWVLRDDPARRAAIVVDPGPDDDEHLRAILDAAGSVPLIVLTHGHADHSAAAAHLHELTGAAVLALDPAHRLGGEGLSEGAVISAAGVVLRAWNTPGHSSDSVSLLLEDDAVLTGDTILGRGTTVVAHPDGVLADYLHSLHRLTDLQGMTVLPGHGPELPDAGSAAQRYLTHRQQRLDQIRQVLAEQGADLSVSQIVATVYADVGRALWPAAETSVRAQLLYLRSELNEPGGPAARDRE